MRGRFNWTLVAALVAGFALASGCGDDDEDGGDGGGGDAPAELQLTDADDGGSFEVAAEGTVIIALPSNPSTGYSWAIVAPEPANLELDGEPKYVPAGSTTPVAGAGGTEVFTLKATDTGEAALKMEYRRPFEPDVPAEQTFNVTITVR